MTTNRARPRRRNVVPGHAIRWFVWGNGTDRPVKIPHTSRMRGEWGWDASCECGWQTRTGGATRTYVEGEVWMHKFENRTDETEGDR